MLLSGIACCTIAGLCYSCGLCFFFETPTLEEKRLKLQHKNVKKPLEPKCTST